MIYSEAAYFDGAHVQHIADYYEVKRIERIRNDGRKAVQAIERRRGSRAPMLRLVA